MANAIKESSEYKLVNQRYPHITKMIDLYWGLSDLNIYLNNIFNDSRSGKRQGLPSDVSSALWHIFEEHTKEFPNSVLSYSEADKNKDGQKSVYKIVLPKRFSHINREWFTNERQKIPVGSAVEIYFDETEYIDSMAIGMLLILKDRFNDVSFINMNESMKKLAYATRIDKIFKIV